MRRILFLSFLIVVISGIDILAEPVKIKELHYNDEDGIPLLSGDTVTVNGVITVPTGVFNNYSTVVYIEDTTGGIPLYRDDQSISFSLNDSIEATGEVTQYKGLTEINLITGTVISNTLPIVPIFLTTDEIAHSFKADFSEPLEGMLIGLKDVVYTGIWPNSGESAELTINDGTGAVKLYINRNTDIPGTTPPNGPFDIVGIISQYDRKLPYDYQYEIVPRFTSDLAYHNSKLTVTRGPWLCLVTDTSVTVDWETNYSGNSIVKYGIGTNLTDSVVIDSLMTRHTVEITGLLSSIAYNYKIKTVNLSDTVIRGVYTFRTGSGNLTSFRFITLADSRAADENSSLPDALRDILFRIEGFNPDLIFFVGDAIFGSSDSIRLKEQWDEWKMFFARAARYVPIYPIIGNHEANCYNQNYDGGKLFAQEFVLPQNGPSSFKELVYSLEYGNAHFSILDSDVYNDQSRINLFQREWLLDDLSNTSKIHRFSFQHEEAYPPIGSTGRSLENYPQERDAFWHILYQNSVEADICGHIHLWNRDFFGRVLPDTVTAVKQIINGTCGASIVHGYGGEFYHFVVWNVSGENVHFDVFDDRGILMDSLSYTVTSIKEVAGKSQGKNVFSILNPLAKGKLKVKLSLKNRRQVLLNIYSVNGSLVKKIDGGRLLPREQTMQIDVRNLKSGIYFLKMKGAMKTLKFVCIH